MKATRSSQSYYTFQTNSPPPLLARTFVLASPPPQPQIISLRQPRTSSSTTTAVSVEMHPRLRKVVVALADVDDDDMRVKKGEKISKKGNPKYKGIPVDFVHTDTGTKVKCDNYALLALSIIN